MKAIIIDDEKHVREGLLLLADWEKYGIDTIYEATDGEEAIRLIGEHQPSIIFTDMNMPRCDGIDLLKWISSANLDAKTIVISGYEDFKYTRNAITYGSFDYLLKPINPADLSKTLSRAIEQWNEENKQRLSHKENGRVIWDHLLSSSLTKAKLPQRVLEHMKKEFQLEALNENYTFALMSMKAIIQQKYEGDANQAFLEVTSLINEWLAKQDPQQGIAFHNINKDEELAILFWGSHDLDEMIYSMHKQLHDKLNLPGIFAVGVSSKLVNSSYETAASALNLQNLLHPGPKRNVEIEKRQTKKLVHLFDYSEDIKWAIQSGSTDQVDRILNGIFKSFETDKEFTIAQLELWESQFKMLTEHWLKEYKIETKDDLYNGDQYWDTQGNFSFLQFKKEKALEFHHLINLVYQTKFQKEKNTFQMIEDYIKSNYQRDLKLQEIADRFYLSREYISRKFKQEYQVTMTDFIMKIRLEKAKELLENPFLKVYEIAEQVGYPNDKYFIKLFKKVEGVTPSEYRNVYKQRVK